MLKFQILNVFMQQLFCSRVQLQTKTKDRVSSQSTDKAGCGLDSILNLWSTNTGLKPRK